jgi:hypothetical protein
VAAGDGSFYRCRLIISDMSCMERAGRFEHRRTDEGGTTGFIHGQLLFLFGDMQYLEF